MHQVEVHVVNPEVLQRRGNALLDAVVPGVVELGGDPDLVAGNTRVADAGTDFGLVAVGQSGVDVTVTLQQRILDRLPDLIGLGLPGAQADGGDFVTRVESVGFPID